MLCYVTIVTVFGYYHGMIIAIMIVFCDVCKTIDTVSTYYHGIMPTILNCVLGYCDSLHYDNHYVLVV